MAYEILIATGTDKGADADSTLEMALVYNEGASQIISDYFKPGQYSNRSNAYENGQLDICGLIPITKNGVAVNTDDFVGVMIKFHDKDWQLDSIWVTNAQGGKCMSKKVDKFFGSKYDVGTKNNPYKLILEQPYNAVTPRTDNDFTLTIRTESSSQNGTDDHVFFKLFDDTGHASEGARKHQLGNQFEAGQTDTLPKFMTAFGPLSKNIVEVLIVKVGNNGWKPSYMMVTGNIMGKENEFDLASNLPSEGSLDTHHNWMTAPRS